MGKIGTVTIPILSGWTIFPPSTNIGKALTDLQAAGVTVRGFDHHRRVFVGCRIDPARVGEIAPAVLGDVEPLA